MSNELFATAAIISTAFAVAAIFHSMRPRSKVDPFNRVIRLESELEVLKVTMGMLNQQAREEIQLSLLLGERVRKLERAEKHVTPKMTFNEQLPIVKCEVEE